jgi:hypothetical protein
MKPCQKWVAINWGATLCPERDRHVMKISSFVDLIKADGFKAMLKIDLTSSSVRTLKGPLWTPYELKMKIFNFELEEKLDLLFDGKSDGDSPEAKKNYIWATYVTHIIGYWAVTLSL